VEAAPDHEALANGVYEAEPTKIEIFHAKSGTPGIKIHWRIVAGEFTGRRIWQDLWLSPAALPFTKRVLAELRMPSPDSPIPDGIVCAVQVVRKVSETTGVLFNEVKQQIKFLRIEENPFAPEAQQPAAPAVASEVSSPPTASGKDGDSIPAAVAVAPNIHPSTPKPEAVSPAEVLPGAAGQLIQIVLDANYGSMVGAHEVMKVGQVVPVDDPSDSEELGKLLPGMTSNTVMYCLEVLTKYGGLKYKGHRGNPLHWWAGSRPALDVQDPLAVEKPVAVDSDFFGTLKAMREAKQVGGTADVVA
jgi:hypothetical protein